MASPKPKIEEIPMAVTSLRQSLGEKFILIGGAGLVCLGSERITSDIDLLFSSESVARVALTLDQTQGVTRRAGAIYSRGGGTEFPVDILERIIGDKTYQDLEPFTVTILGGIRTLDYPISLGIKIRCWYMRSETGPGLLKKESDLMDIAFICNKMQGMGRVVGAAEAKAIPIGCYNMLLAKTDLERNGKLEVFLAVGGDKFQVPWEDDTEEQREYYMMEMASEEENDAEEAEGGDAIE